MYVDFEIDNNGDLVFEEKKNTSQKISFNISNSSSQKVSFSLFNFSTSKHNSNNYLSVEFLIDRLKDKSLSKAVKGENALAQLIELKLKTTLGTLPERIDFGSKMSLFKHKNINEKSLNELKAYLLSLLKNDIPNLSIDVSPYINYSNGYDQTVKIDIYSSNKLLLNYKIEG